MTKQFLTLFAVLSTLLMPLHSYADKGGKGPSDQAYKNASDNASFKDHKDKDRDWDKDWDKDKDKDKYKKKDKGKK